MGTLDCLSRVSYLQYHAIYRPDAQQQPGSQASLSRQRRTTNRAIFNIIRRGYTRAFANEIFPLFYDTRK